MSKITGNVTDFTPRAHTGAASVSHTNCWVCQTGVTARAAFCHECGTVQHVRPLDHFTRLGLDRRFDLDRDQLEGRAMALARVFHAERFSAKGPRQKHLAQEQLSAVEEAFMTLRDPVRRAEYLLTLLDAPPATTEAVSDPALDQLRDDLAQAADAAAIDRVAFKAGHGVESAIRDLSAAFRQENFAEVAVILARLAQFEDIASAARARRSHA